jgi:AraC family transcriptional regulator, transcriptional activator of pobA
VPSDHRARCADPAEQADAVFVHRYASRSEEGHAASATVTHPYAALAFCTAGRIHTEQRGRFSLERGDALLVPAGMPHRTSRVEQREAWSVGFAAASFAARDAEALLAPFERVRAGASAVVRVPAERHAFLESLFAELSEASRGARHAGPVQRSLLTLIVHEIARAAQWSAPPGGPAPAGVVAASLAVIERRCLSALTLGQVAAAVGRSPAYVTTALRRETGRSAIAWITAGRMAEARRLLLHSHEPVETIAGRVGYADTTHFIRTFRREHGATPAAWRTSQRGRAA